MTNAEWIFWISGALIIYTYIGYGGLLFVLLKVKRAVFGKTETPGFEELDLPEVILIIPAYNEQTYIKEKALNSLRLDYPADKFRILFVTDGSDDATPEIVNKIEGVELLHQPQRNGKIMAMNRAMKQVSSEIVVFSDANTTLNRQAIREIVKHYADPTIGCVSGEKRILVRAEDSAAGSGEGAYWRYESLLKKLDFEFYSVVGAAGELFSIRTALYEHVEPDTLLDDFVISLRIALRGFRIAYEPNAFAMEKPSFDIAEELKRKIRICAGGIQSICRLKSLLNPFEYGRLSFLYISHRVLRWTLTPIALLLFLGSNAMLSYKAGGFFTAILAMQIAFYLMAIVGRGLANREISLKIFFIPYYFFIMNYAVFMGFFRFMKGNQSVLWDRAKRA